MNINFGKLTDTDLRDVWPLESKDFTPWLAKEENLQQLGKAVGIDLSLVDVEQEVGPYRADIVCRDEASDNVVLIENQLEKTNHKHFGQTLTYASGTKAKSIIWIASSFTDEHRGAVDWLNNITDDNFNFFGIEIKAKHIGNSAIAPLFEIVSKPNDWSKSMNSLKKYSDNEDLSSRKKLLLKYWTAVSTKIKENGSFLKPHKPRPQHWYNLAIGKTGFKIAGTVKTSINTIGGEVYITNNKEAFKYLENNKEEIEKEIDAKLSWEYLPEKVASRIAIYKEDINLMESNNWDTAIDWHISKFEKLHNIFSQRIKNFDINEMKEAA